MVDVERTEDGGWLRRVPGWTSGGYPAVVFLAARDDVSAVQVEYSAACASCWVGATHTEALHNVQA